MASVTFANALLNPRKVHDGITTVVVRGGSGSAGSAGVGGEGGSLDNNTYMLAKIPTGVTIIDGYIRSAFVSGSANFVVTIGTSNVVTSQTMAAAQMTRFNNTANLPLRISVSDDAVNQWVWANLITTGAASKTANWSVDVVITYAQFGAGEAS